MGSGNSQLSGNSIKFGMSGLAQVNFLKILSEKKVSPHIICVYSSFLRSVKFVSPSKEVSPIGLKSLALNFRVNLDMFSEEKQLISASIDSIKGSKSSLVFLAASVQQQFEPSIRCDNSYSRP